MKIAGAFANWASGAAMCRKISRWNLHRASDEAIPNQAPGTVGEDVETGWRASLGEPKHCVHTMVQLPSFSDGGEISL
jgi:hypothetical protein